ncbi:MAG: sulfite exporter TauE/SafE family protein [Methanosarcinales archaeon]|nr:sulfite exporter TauE/SafE family protein [Methanosarcinales archaeon]
MTEWPAFLVMLAAMLVRTLTGFGSALISVPLLSVLFGAKFAIPFIMLYECLIDIMILAREDQRAVKKDLKMALPLLIAGLVGIPLGTEVLIMSSERLLRSIMGMALILFSLLLLMNFDLRIRREQSGFVLAGLAGGFLCGSIGMPGPPMALLLSSQGFGKETFRRVMVIFLTAIDVFTFIYFVHRGLITTDMILLSLKLLPALVLGFLLGSLAYARLEAIYFRRVVLMMTMTAGMILLASELRL